MKPTKDAPFAANATADLAMFFRIVWQFWRGFHFLRHTRKAITIFGSARIHSEHPYYEEARRAAFLLSKKGFSIITGGGPSLMMAANQGAKEAGGESIGVNIHIPREQRINPHVTRGFKSRYFFVRKVLLCRYSEGFIVFPGGFGTLDETFEILTLIQTGKMIDRPIALVNKKFWSGFMKWCEDVLIPEGMINRAEFDRLKVVDTAEEAVAIVSPIQL